MSTENLAAGFALVSSGVVIILICLPLLKDGVKPNALYGIRLPKSFESDENWYKMNRYGAKQLILWSGMMIAFGLVTFFLPLQGKPAFVVIICLSEVLFLVIPLIQIVRYSKRL